jgi:hypothetical protein
MSVKRGGRFRGAQAAKTGPRLPSLASRSELGKCTGIDRLDRCVMGLGVEVARVAKRRTSVFSWGWR